jgi:hypothetical protein
MLALQRQGRNQMMRRITAVMTLAFTSIVLSAGAALADATYPPPTTVVKGASGSRGDGGTAFTGSTQLPFAMLMIGVLVIAGLTALYIARRRSSRLAV